MCIATRRSGCREPIVVAAAGAGVELVERAGKRRPRRAGTGGREHAAADQSPMAIQLMKVSGLGFEFRI